MKNIELYIKKLKSQYRKNFYFFRRRIEKGNGKKTLGWILKDEKLKNISENIDFYKLNDVKNKY